MTNTGNLTINILTNLLLAVDNLNTEIRRNNSRSTLQRARPVINNILRSEFTTETARRRLESRNQQSVPSQIQRETNQSSNQTQTQDQETLQEGNSNQQTSEVDTQGSIRNLETE